MDLPHKYSVADVANFTRWYLQDYPVKRMAPPQRALGVRPRPRHVLETSNGDARSHGEITYLAGLVLPSV
jgi:hypothetical protein